MAGTLVAGPSSALSGWDAVRLFGVGHPSPPNSTVLVLATGGRHRRFNEIWIRPTRRPYDLRLVYLDELDNLPLPCVEPARAIADAALLLGAAKPVRALVSSAIQRGLCAPDDLLRELEGCPRNGSGFFRQSLEDVLNNAHSIAEAEAADLLVAEGVPGFEMNVPLVDDRGQVIRYADLLWRELRAAFEVDSREFHFDEDSWERTTARHNQLTSYGLALEHGSPKTIRRGGSAWARQIHTWLRNRARELDVRVLPVPGVIRPGPSGVRPFLLGGPPTPRW